MCDFSIKKCGNFPLFYLLTIYKIKKICFDILIYFLHIFFCDFDAIKIRKFRLQLISKIIFVLWTKNRG